MYSFIAVTIFLFISPFINVDAQNRRQLDCITPDGIAGSCTRIRECPPVLALLQSQPLNPENVNYLKQLQCGFEGTEPRVCCKPTPTRPPSGQTDDTIYPGTIPLTDLKNGIESGNTSVAELFNNPLLPNDCGKVLNTKIVGGTRADLDEFPWMALLEYYHPNGRSTSCGGVLISKRYVLTAAHCVKGKDLPATWNLRSVRLGEYDTESDQDCIDNEEVKLCADDPITVGIEEQIAHEEYRPYSTDQKYDIALLRLSRDITSTNYIRPICLPRTPSFGDKLFVAGWGKTENQTSSNIKLKLSLPLTKKEDCERNYAKIGIRLGYGQVCAGGQKGKDSCRGDSGGSLMAIEKFSDDSSTWTAVGIVSFGPSPCGLAGWAGVYTRVYDFVPWIISKMRP